MVGEGFTAICEETSFTTEDVAWVNSLFEALGKAVVLPERLFDAIVAVSGSSPAYVFVFVEALIDAGIKLGLPREIADQSLRADGAGFGKNAAGNGRASRQAQGYGLLSGRHDHRGDRVAGRQADFGKRSFRPRPSAPQRARR